MTIKFGEIIKDIIKALFEIISSLVYGVVLIVGGIIFFVIIISLLIPFFQLPIKTITTILFIIEFFVLLSSYYWRKIILDIFEDSINLSFSNLVIFYYVFTLSICIPIITLINYIFPFNLIINLLLLLSLLILWIIFIKDNERLFLLLIPKYYREKVGILEINWNSPEFEKFVGKELVELYLDTQKLIKIMKNKRNTFSDYSFAVFPLAKAYEGVLKKILVKTGFITKAQLEQDPNISINSYFNPMGNSKITKALRDNARDKVIPYLIYSTYAECRNQILHHDQYRDNRLKTIEEADFYARRISDAIYKAYITFKKAS